jgi:hypothetical protein
MEINPRPERGAEMINLQRAIKESEEIEAAATPGPWQNQIYFMAPLRDFYNPVGPPTTIKEQALADAEMLAHARNELAKFREACKIMSEALSVMSSSFAREATDAVEKIFEEKCHR